MIESRTTERPEFAVFANSLVDFYPDMESLSWGPFLTEEELPVFVELVLMDGIDNLQLQLLPDDLMINVIRNNRHFISEYYFIPQQPYTVNFWV